MQPPGPSGSLLWGSFKKFQMAPLSFLTDSAEEYGDLVQFRFAHMKAYLVNNPSLIEEVLLVKADHFDKATRSAGKIRATCGDSLLSAKHDTWERHRKLIQPVFQPKFIASMDGMIEEATHSLLHRWEDIAGQKKTIELVSEMTALVIEISAKALFAADISPEKLETALAVLLDDTWRRVQSPIDLADISAFFHRQDFKQALSEVDETVFDIIAKRHVDGIDHDDVLSRLLAMHDEDSETGLNDKELRDAVITLLLAGHETTSSALSWAFYLLAMQPEKIPEDGNFENVFRETLRLYPSIWIVERRVKEPTQIGDYTLAKGSSVLISPYVLHRNSGFWENPEQFNPDRFLQSEVEKRPRNSYLPFGLGRHRCVGLHMASRISTNVLSLVHQRFRLIPMLDKAPVPDPGITLRHEQKINCQIETLS